MIEASQVTGVILCGGHSSRMGFNKALLKVEGQYVLPQTANRVGQILSDVVLVTNDRQNFTGRLGFEHLTIWEDDYPDAGPLGGLVTALKRVKTPYIFLMACDIPAISGPKILPLLAAGHEEQVLLYQQEGRMETLFGLYHQSCLPLFEAQLAQGNGKIRYHFDKLNVRLIQDSDVELRNINTPAELPGWRIKKIMR